MRKVNYVARNGFTTITTTSYTVATSNGFTVEKTFLTAVDSRTEKDKAIMRCHAEKVKEKKGWK